MQHHNIVDVGEDKCPARSAIGVNVLSEMFLLKSNYL